MALCGKYSASDLKAQITIQRKSAVADGMGGLVDTWTANATPRAMWRALTGSELYQAQRINPRVTVKAVIRFKGDAHGAPYYTAADRVTYRNRTYDIAAVIDADDRQEWLELHLIEGKAS